MVVKVVTFRRDFEFEDDYWVTISKNIKKFRAEAKITQEQLAVDVGKSYDFIRRLEFRHGEIHCSFDTLYKISVVLNHKIDDFLDDDEDDD